MEKMKNSGPYSSYTPWAPASPLNDHLSIFINTFLNIYNIIIIIFLNYKLYNNYIIL